MSLVSRSCSSRGSSSGTSHSGPGAYDVSRWYVWVAVSTRRANRTPRRKRSWGQQRDPVEVTIGRLGREDARRVRSVDGGQIDQQADGHAGAERGHDVGHGNILWVRGDGVAAALDRLWATEDGSSVVVPAWSEVERGHSGDRPRPECPPRPAKLCKACTR